MQLSPEQLKQIEAYASIFMPVGDIAVILDTDPLELRAALKDRSPEVYRAYTRGKLASKAKLMAQEMQLAQVGSPLALENTRANLLAMEDEEDL